MKLIENLERIANAIEQLSRDAQRRPEIDDNLFSSIAKRLADVEARQQKIESLITRSTVAGNVKLSDTGKEVAKNWYQK